jgi:hypothetical protein
VAISDTANRIASLPQHVSASRVISLRTNTGLRFRFGAGSFNSGSKSWIVASIASRRLRWNASIDSSRAMFLATGAGKAETG